MERIILKEFSHNGNDGNGGNDLITMAKIFNDFQLSARHGNDCVVDTNNR